MRSFLDESHTKKMQASSCKEQIGFCRMLGKQKCGLTSITSGLPVNPEQAESSNHANATRAILRLTCAETDCHRRDDPRRAIFLRKEVFHSLIGHPRTVGLTNFKNCQSAPQSRRPRHLPAPPALRPTGSVS